MGNPPSLQPKIVIAFVTPLGHEQLVGLHRLKALWEKKQITPATDQKISDKYARALIFVCCVSNRKLKLSSQIKTNDKFREKIGSFQHSQLVVLKIPPELSSLC